MPLTGQAKTDYQREYMRKRRIGKPVRPPSVRPVLDPKYSMAPFIVSPTATVIKVPQIDADGNVMPDYD